MLFRKIYIKIRLFLYSIRNFLNVTAITLMVATLSYLFINSFVLERFVINQARENKEINKYENAISFYKIAYSYYQIDHFSANNKKLYFEMPYEIAICYLNEGKLNESVLVMLNAVNSIEKQYGFLSEENAYFIRKYKIAYFMKINHLNLAKREFNTLFDIYKRIHCTQSDLADLLRLSGDIYYNEKIYDRAIEFYQKAYSLIINQENMDYEVFADIVNKICEYDIKNNQTNQAIDLYKKSVIVLQRTNNDEQDLTAKMLIDLGNLYTKDDKSLKDAVKSYEDAIAIIKKLPRKNPLRQDIVKYMSTLKDLYTKNSQFVEAENLGNEIIRHSRFSFLF